MQISCPTTAPAFFGRSFGNSAEEKETTLAHFTEQFGVSLLHELRFFQRHRTEKDEDRCKK